MLGPFTTASCLTLIHQVSPVVLLRTACASMYMTPTTTTTTSTRDRGDRYGPMNGHNYTDYYWWSSAVLLSNKLIKLRDRDDSKYKIIKQHFCEMWIIKLRQKSTYMLIRTRHIVSKTRASRCNVDESFTITIVLSYGSVHNTQQICKKSTIQWCMHIRYKFTRSCP